MKKFLLFLTSILLLLISLSQEVFSVVHYVNDNASGSNNGTSWTNAFTSLQSALEAASSGDEIWVAAGTYLPTKDIYGDDSPTNNLAKCFTLKNGVAIYGGFAGTEILLTQRDYNSNISILSGDLNSDDSYITDINEINFPGTNMDNNCVHVIYNPTKTPNINSTAVLDGFTIQGGYAFGVSGDTINSGGGIYNVYSSPTLRNLIIKHNAARMGGAVNNRNSSPIITSVVIEYNYAVYGGAINNSIVPSAVFDKMTIRYNRAGTSGGAMYEFDGTYTLKNSFIYGNISSGAAGAFYLNRCSQTIINTVISRNTASSIGGAFYYQSQSQPTFKNVNIVYNQSTYGGAVYFSGSTSSSQFNNSIIWGNISTNNQGHQFYIGTNPPPTLNFCCYSNAANDIWTISGETITATNNNITSDPLFVNADNNDFRIYGISPCVDSGADTANTETYDIRQSGYSRKLLGTDENSNGTIDIGAYEYKHNTDPEYPIIYVNAAMSDDNGDGLTWGTAKKSFQSALSLAVSGYHIWVAKGTYKPESAYNLINTSRYYHFRMKPGVEIYGGFAGTETAVSQRTDFGEGGANETILSGDLNGNGLDANDCYHIFYHPDGVGLTNSAVLDGFTIKGALANGMSEHSTGAGIYCINNSPTLRNIILTGNNSSGGGAGMRLSDNSNAILINVLIYGNNSGTSGGGIYIYGSNVTANNVTLTKNIASNEGGGIYAQGGTSNFNNSIVFGNTTNWQAYQLKILSSTTLNFNYSCYSNNANDISNDGIFTPDGNSITTDPRFADADNDDYRLTWASLCADAGNGEYNSEDYDIRGTSYSRKLDKDDANQAGTIDMGAYEYKLGSDPIGIPTTQASNITFPTVTSTSLNISWTSGDGTKRAVFVKAGAGAITNPSDNATYSASANWSSKGTQLGTSGYYCVYNGTGNSVSVTNLSKNTSYYVQVFEYNGPAGYETYLKTTAADNPNSQSTDHPTITITATGFDDDFGNQLINTNSSARSYTVSGSGLQGDITITAPTGFQVSLESNANFASSKTLSPTAKVVTTTTLYVRFSPTLVQTYGPANITHASTDATTENVSVQGEGINQPSSQATGIIFSNVTRTSMTVRWTRGDGEGSVLLGRMQYRIPSEPLTDGTPHTGNANYTAATTVNGAKILYFGTDANPIVSVTNLSRYQLVYFKVCEYNNSLSPVYLQTENSANPRARWTLRRDGLMEEDLTIDAEYPYPNPVSNIISTTLDVFEAGNVSALLYDASGRLIKELYNEQLAFGTYELKFNLSDINSGVYQLIITKGSEAVVYPVSVLK